MSFTWDAVEQALLFGIVSTLFSAAILWLAALMVGVESSMKKAIFAAVAIWVCGWMVTATVGLLDPSMHLLAVIGQYAVPLFVIQLVFMTEFGQTLLLWFASQAVGFLIGLIGSAMHSAPGH